MPLKLEMALAIGLFLCSIFLNTKEIADRIAAGAPPPPRPAYSGWVMVTVVGIEIWVASLLFRLLDYVR